MSAPVESPRVALLTNLVAPYRVALYDEIARYLELEVLFSGHEDNRTGWEGADRGLKRAHARRVWGWVLKLKRPANENPAKEGAEPFDVRYLHISPGYWRDLRRFRPDAIVTTEMGARTLVALAYGFFARIPVWVMIESSLHTVRNTGRLRAFVRRVIARRARRWFAVGTCAMEYLSSLRVPRGQVIVIQNTVDERPFRAARRLSPVIHPKPLALCVGQLVPRKGVGLLLEALAALSARGIDMELRIAGDGPERRRLEARARELELHDVHFLGHRTTSEIAVLFARSDFLVFPTLEDVWGLVVNEALWAGLPVLASRYAGCAQELLPAENIFDPLDQEGFVAALQRAAVEGLAPADETPLWTTAMAARRVAETLLATLGAPVPRPLDEVARP